MSREILFRGKTKKNDWVYGFYVKNSRGECLIVQDLLHVDGAEYNSDEFEIIPESVGQFIGLTDKNGAKIFEGDVLKSNQWGTLVIVWISENACFGCFHPKTGLHPNIFGYQEAEIIGNIHDNPELIGKEVSNG